jgi:hypothetical protein
MAGEHKLLKATLKCSARITAAAYCPAGQYIASACAGEAAVRLVVRQTAATEFPRTLSIELGEVGAGAGCEVTALAFSAGDGFLLTVALSDGQLLVYRVFRQVTRKPTLEAQFASGHDSAVAHLYMSNVPSAPEEYFIASLAGAQLKLWPFAKGTRPKSPVVSLALEPALGAAVKRMQWSRGNRHLALVGCDAAAALYEVRFTGGGGGGGRRAAWGIEPLDASSRIELGALATAADLDFGQRSPVVLAALGDAWRVARLKGAALADLAVFRGGLSDAAPFDALALVESRSLVVAAKAADLYVFSYKPDDAGPQLVHMVKGALDSPIAAIRVSPDEDEFLTLGESSYALRLWALC